MEATKPAGSNITKLIWVLVAAILLAVVVLAPLPDRILNLDGAQLTQQGRVVLGVLFFCLLLWIAEPIPFHIAGLVGMILLALLKAESFVNVVKLGFGNDTVLFFIGVLAISAAITKSGLGRRISMMILRLTGNKTSHIILGFLIAGALIGMWITTLAAAAMLMPLARSIAEEEHLEPGKSRFGKALFIAVAWGSLIGGAGSPAGGGANNLAIGFVRDMLGTEITFAGWMLYGVPCMLLLILPAWWILMAFFKPEIKQIRRSSEDLRSEYATLPKMTHNERSTMIIFLLTVVLWLVSKPLGDWIGVKIPTSLPAVLGACLFFLPGVTDIKWKDVESDISWSGILLIASGISLGMLVYQSGAAQWLAMLLLGNIGTLPVLVQIISVILIVIEQHRHGDSRHPDYDRGCKPARPLAARHRHACGDDAQYRIYSCHQHADQRDSLLDGIFFHRGYGKERRDHDAVRCAYHDGGNLYRRQTRGNLLTEDIGYAQTEPFGNRIHRLL